MYNINIYTFYTWDYVTTEIGMPKSFYGGIYWDRLTTTQDVSNDFCNRYPEACGWCKLLVHKWLVIHDLDIS
jgi:hypothetical protein